MKATPRPIAVVYLSTHVPDMIKQGFTCLAALTGHPVLVNPTPTMAVFGANLVILNTATTAAGTKAKGLIQARDAKMIPVVTNMHQLRAYVQSVADTLPPDQAEALILSAGMSIRKVNPRKKNQIAAKQGSISGLVHLTAAVAASKASYQWQMSTDQKTWTNLPLLFRTKTTVSGLTPATVYYFRYQATIAKTGTGDWSQVVSLLVK